MNYILRKIEKNSNHKNNQFDILSFYSFMNHIEVYAINSNMVYLLCMRFIICKNIKVNKSNILLFIKSFMTQSGLYL
jgi:hypothetical protein